MGISHEHQPALLMLGRGTMIFAMVTCQSLQWFCRGVVAAVQKEYPHSMLMAVGWSLGANILVRYLGETRSGTPLAAAASLCNPFNLVSPVLISFAAYAAQKLGLMVSSHHKYVSVHSS